VVRAINIKPKQSWSKQMPIKQGLKTKLSAIQVIAVVLGFFVQAPVVATESVRNTSQAQCAPWQDSAAQLTLGQFELGHPYADFPPHLPHDDCGTAPSPDEEVCEHRDPKGFAYLVDSSGVIRVEARRLYVNAKTVLPLGLRLGDSRKATREKLNALASESPVARLGIGTNFNRSVWATAYCVQSKHGSLGSFYLKFDRAGKLATIGIRANAN
jgi:hypothetical protein